MVTIEVCIGSSCFVKGSNEVVAFLKNYIIEHQLEDKILLKGAFCMGMCTQGLGIRINDKQIPGVTLYNMQSLIEKELNAIL